MTDCIYFQKKKNCLKNTCQIDPTQPAIRLTRFNPWPVWPSNSINPTRSARFVMYSADTGFHCNWADFQKAQITYCHKGETRLGMGLSLKTCAAQDEGVNYYMGGGLAVSGPRLGLIGFSFFKTKVWTIIWEEV